MTQQLAQRGGRRTISTHTLTWSVTRLRKSCARYAAYFNSHAHVERDNDPAKAGSFSDDFNSHAHVERDNDPAKAGSFSDDFNSHAHVERDKMGRR